MSVAVVRNWGSFSSINEALRDDINGKVYSAFHEKH